MLLPLEVCGAFSAFGAVFQLDISKREKFVSGSAFTSKLWGAVDVVAYCLSYPFLICVSCLVTLYYEREATWLKLLRCFFFGPFLVAWTFITLSPAWIGQLLWILIHRIGPKRDFTILELNNTKNEVAGDEITFTSANLLLGMDALGKFQNMKGVYGRTSRLRSTLSSFLSSPATMPRLSTLRSNPSKASAVVAGWPDADFYLLQEVWDRVSMYNVMVALKEKFGYFVGDVGEHTLESNFCAGSSGLMICSRYPVMTAHFVPFPNKKSWQRLISYGCIMVKVDLDAGQPLTDPSKKRRVGFIGNLHTMAYQEKENQIGQALEQVRRDIAAFRADHTDFENETVVCSVLGGDFNFDNVSPGDRPNHDHNLFKEYVDIGAAGPGQDELWALGTELRQLRVHDARVDSMDKFKVALDDKAVRRRYVIDADVEVQTTELMFCDPKPEANGDVIAKPDFGGLRRIDRILFDPDLEMKAEGVAFLSVGAGDMDHIPVALTLKTKK